jgi:hypothetical protein
MALAAGERNAVGQVPIPREAQCLERDTEKPQKRHHSRVRPRWRKGPMPGAAIKSMSGAKSDGLKAI